PLRTIALLTSSLFLAMLLASTACMAAQDLSPGSPDSHHSKREPLHGALCNWACHNGKISSTSLTSSLSWHAPFQAMDAIASPYALPGLLTPLSPKSARAPPPFFVSLFS
ncbi:MAG TPA: hypothetical protein DD706_09070, partial [Nitrospiraceae bacterium]|nr:hypothetical protein [Nitrospiraceae bacterium]